MRFMWPVFSVLLAASSASAEESSPNRERPDYDGRGAEPPTPGDVALWVPRVVLSPLWFTSEYVVRRPLGAIIAGAERAHVPTVLYDFFAFGPDHKAGIVPTAFLDFGFNPSVGVYAFWDDAFVSGHALRLSASGWTSEWLAASFAERYRWNARDFVALHLGAVRRPDHVFFGVGPRTLEADIGRFGEDRLEGSGAVEVHPWRSSRVAAEIGVRSASFHHGHFGRDASVEQNVASGVYSAPDGLSRGYTAQTNRAVAALDTREPRPAPGSGVRVELEAEEANDVRRSSFAGWIRYGGTAAAYYDLNDRARVVSLSLTGLFADPLSPEPVPFTELVSLGGSGSMRGFMPGRLVDRSAAIATLHYRWPIWVWLDGSLQAATGNVFGPHLRDFEPRLLRLSGAVGVESVGSPDSSFEILVGAGTETFEHGAQIDSVRLVIGTNRGF